MSSQPKDAKATPDHPMIPVPDAIRIVLRTAASALMTGNGISRTEILPLATTPFDQLLGRTLAKDVLMEQPGYPPYNASIMDGYAVRLNETRGYVGTHVIVDKVFAGDDTDKATKTGDATECLGNDEKQNDKPQPIAVYVTTGAAIPNGFDCVVPIEQCRMTTVGTAADRVAILQPTDEKVGGIDATTVAAVSSIALTEGKWIRKVGCDIPAGSVVLPKDHVLDAAAVGLLLQSGIEAVSLRVPLKVGVLSTGNELLLPGEPMATAGTGRIPDANRPVLLSLLGSFGTCTPVDLGIQRDDDAVSITATLRAAANECDVIITSGGVSMGESDIVESVLTGNELRGTLHFGRLHMKPGKPTTFVSIAHESQRRPTLVFGMPGNPVSAYVCTQLLVRPCLDLLFEGPEDDSGDVHGESLLEMERRIVQNAFTHPEQTVVLGHDMKLDKERPEYHRVTTAFDSKTGKTVVFSTGVQRSSRLMSLRDAEGLVVLPQGVPGTGGKMKALAGEEYTMLRLAGHRRDHVRLADSLHLNKKANRSLRVSIVRVLDDNDNGSDAEDRADAEAEVASTVRLSLSGSKSGPADIISISSFIDEAAGLYNHILDNALPQRPDVVCVVARTRFLRHLDVVSELRRRLQKVADGLSLQARKGAAAEHASSALLECLVGYIDTERTKDDIRSEGAVLVCVPQAGVAGALSNVRGLLKHALEVARPND